MRALLHHAMPVSMENGGKLRVNECSGHYSLQLIKHRPQLCHEYVITLPTVHVRAWILWTFIFNCIGFSLKLQSHDARVICATIGLVSVALLLKLHFKVTKESLLVLSSTGVQLTTTFALGRRSAKFYDMAHIHDIVINEAITMHRVISYLTLLVRDKKATHSQTITQLIPLFQHSWPSLACLQKIYRDVQVLLKKKKAVDM